MKQSKTNHFYTHCFAISFAFFLLSTFSVFAQKSAFLNLPENQVFKNKNNAISVKNVKYTEYYKEFDCKWETSHAVLQGMKDTIAQNYMNDWLSAMTFFGTCDGDHECLDIAAFHYFYKMTYVTHVENDLFGFFQKAGNCKSYDTPCCETQDWEVYDLSQKRFLLESDIFRQDTKSQEALFEIIARKVSQKNLKLIPDWKAFDRQIGIDNQQIVIYLLEDVVGVSKGLTLEFKADEIAKVLKADIAKRLYK